MGKDSISWSGQIFVAVLLTDPGLAHGHNVKSSSREKTVEGILHFLGCAAGMCTRPSIILSGN